MAEPESQHSLRSLLCTEERDFLIKSNGDRVKVEDLEGKIVGLYFSALSSPLCRAFTPTLSEVYTELLENGGFEIIFVSKDKHENLFEEYHKTMPWLALPFSDTKVKEKLNQLFDVKGIPTLILLDQECKTISASGVRIIGEYGAEAYPFSKERIGELKAEEELIRLSQSLNSLLVSPDRDFVIANGGRNVPVSELVGKTVCLYFSAHWCPPCKGFTPRLIKFYNDLKSKGEDLEIVFISSDRDGESFQQYFGSMPWLALPYRDRVGKTLTRYFEIEGIPTLIVLGPDGKTLQTEAVEMVMEHGVQVYPFTKEKLDEIKAQEEARRAAQTLESLIVSDERNFVIAHSGEKVPVSELTGKTVGLYFSAHWCAPCRGFTPKLAEVYNKLKEKGEAFEIVFLSSDKDQESFDEYYASMPWLALPFEDKVKNDLSRYFHVRGIPSLVIIGPDGKTLQTEAVEMVLEHGVQVYPFTKEKMDEIKAQEEARRAAQTLESLIVSDERNFVITNSGEKVPVSELTGKTVGLYFSAHWCPPCRGFTPKLAEVYNKLKEKGEAFEIVFLSSDKDQDSFDEYYASMPWLALPFGDKVKNDLSRYFHVRGIPSLVIIGPDGKTVTTDARNIVSVHGAKAYPFTNSRLAELQKEIGEGAKKWPKEVKHSLHQHSLSLTQRQAYNCDGCQEGGSGWSFYCKECDFDLHPDCALKDEDPDKNEKQLPESEPLENGTKPAGVICEGDVCRKV